MSDLVERIDALLESDDFDNRFLNFDALLLEAMQRIQELEENARQTKSCAEEVENLTKSLAKANAKNSQLAQTNHELRTLLAGSGKK